MRPPTRKSGWPMCAPSTASVKASTRRRKPCSVMRRRISWNSGAIGIHVEDAAVPGEPLGLDLELLRIAVAMAARGHTGAERNDTFLQAGALRLCARRE